MDGLKNEHYFGNSNQNNNRTDNNFAREAFDALNYPGGFPNNGRALAQSMQSMQNMQNMQTMQNMQNMQNFPNQGGIPNLQGLPGFPNFQGMPNMLGNNNAQNQANLFNMNMNPGMNQGVKDEQGRGPVQGMQRQQDMGGRPAPLAGMAGRPGGMNNQGGLNLSNLQDIQGIQGMQQMPDFDPQTQLPSEEHNMNYYHEYCRLHVANVVLNTQMNELIQEKNELVARLTQLEKKSEELQRSQSNYYPLEDKKKRFRRVATEIDRHYRCPIESCQKSYGSEGSLNQHLKLKHPEYKIPSEHNGSEAGSTAKGE